MRFNRESVFRVYWLIFVTLVLGIVFLWFAVLVRHIAFPAFYGLITQGIPAIAVAVWRDPLLIPAFVIGSLFLWSFPWGGVFGGGGGGGSSSFVGPVDNVQRGRRVSGPEVANYRAYQELLRRRNRRRGRIDQGE